MSIDASGRFLRRASGAAFMIMGDSPWSLAVNCTHAQIDAYLNDRAAKGCTAILFEAIEAAYSNQNPRYLNVDGQAPFTSMSPVNWTLNDAYWRRVDYIVDRARALGMACLITPAYTGYGNGSDGWLAHYSGASDAALQAYGAALARRYTQGNVVWVLGGDDANDGGASGSYGSAATPDRTKQWQIALGIRSVRSGDLITGHTARNGTAGAVNGEAFKAWGSGYAGFNLNNIYGHDGVDDAAALALAAYSRPGPMPFFLFEAGYEDTDGSNNGGIWPAIQTVLNGGLGGFIGGHDALWHMGSYTPNSGAASVLSTYLSGSWLGFKYLAALFKAYAWQTMTPRRDGSLVTSALGSGAAAVCPSAPADGSFAMIWTPGTSLSINLAALSPTSVRARWFDPGSGAFAAVSGGPFANSGTRTFTPPGNRILVLDAA